jgi:hypothetical protein
VEQAQLEKVKAQEQAQEQAQGGGEVVEWSCPATHSMDLPAAIALALRQTSQLPMGCGNDSSHLPIGATCRVYWDDEGRWFSARVLLYDPVKDLYFIYYDEVKIRSSRVKLKLFMACCRT